MQILQKYGPIEHFNFVYHTNGPNLGQPKGFAFIKYKEVSMNLKILGEIKASTQGRLNARMQLINDALLTIRLLRPV